MHDVSAGARKAAEFVRANPGLPQWRCVRAIQGSSSYTTAAAKVKEARDAGLILTRKVRNVLYLYPPAAPS